jgi:MYXO-CTERM domain-containing protein
VDPAYSELYGFAFTGPLERFFPFWPFIPFLPLFLAAAGAALLGRRRAQEAGT